MSKKTSVDQELETCQAVTQTTAAKILGMRSPGSLRAMRDAPRRPDGRYDLAELVPWYVERQQQVAAASDPLLASPSDSPGLERYRAAKAEHAELDLAERRGELLSVERGRQWVFRIMSRIRQFGDRLRSYPELPAEFREMLEDCKRLVETLKAPEEPDVP